MDELSKASETNMWLRMARVERLNFRISRLYSVLRQALQPCVSAHHILPGTLPYRSGFKNQLVQ
jgi:hypothetical protein